MEAARPGLDVDFHRGASDAIDRGVDAQHVADLDRPDEGHRLDGDRHHPSLSAFDRGDAAGLVHLDEHPAAEDVAVGVGVGGHGGQANGEFAVRLFDGRKLR